jgi:hypothetical protein
MAGEINDFVRGRDDLTDRDPPACAQAGVTTRARRRESTHTLPRGAGWAHRSRSAPCSAAKRTGHAHQSEHGLMHAAVCVRPLGATPALGARDKLGTARDGTEGDDVDRPCPPADAPE